MFGFGRAKHKNTFGFIQATISHKVKDPHSKTLEPDCLSLALRLRHSLSRERGIHYFHGSSLPVGRQGRRPGMGQ